MTRRETRGSSDPLPYVQVDRAVRPLASLLAAELGCTHQHALGSLVCFWDLCGAPRELEAILQALAPGGEPAVVLTGEDLALRWRLASGHQVEPLVLARLGLVEEQAAGGFRVRGMSRYFTPIQARLEARQRAQAAGKASAARRREAAGTAQPTGRWGPPPPTPPPPEPQRPGSDDVRTQFGGGTEIVEQPPNAVRTESEPPPNLAATAPNPADSGQRTASDVRTYVGKKPRRLFVIDDAPATPPPAGLEGTPDAPAALAEAHLTLTPPTASGPEEAEAWGAEDFWRWAQCARRDSLGLVVEAHPGEALATWWAEARRVASVDALLAAFKGFARDDFWRHESKPPLPWAGFVTQWSRWMPAGGARVAR